MATGGASGCDQSPLRPPPRPVYKKSSHLVGIGEAAHGARSVIAVRFRTSPPADAMDPLCQQMRASHAKRCVAPWAFRDEALVQLVQIVGRYFPGVG